MCKLQAPHNHPCCIILTIFIYFLLQVQGNHGLSSQVHLTLLFPGGRRRLIALPSAAITFSSRSATPFEFSLTSTIDDVRKTMDFVNTLHPGGIREPMFWFCAVSNNLSCSAANTSSPRGYLATTEEDWPVTLRKRRGSTNNLDRSEASAKRRHNGQELQASVTPSYMLLRGSDCLGWPVQKVEKSWPIVQAR